MMKFENGCLCTWRRAAAIVALGAIAVGFGLQGTAVADDLGRVSAKSASNPTLGVGDKMVMHVRPDGVTQERTTAEGTFETELLGPFCTVDDCDGQPTDSGADSCDGTTTYNMNVGDFQLVCGDNTAVGGEPESCGALAPDGVWWESVTITECADIMIDYCCTTPVPPTFYIVLSGNCPNCGLIFPTTGDTCVDDTDCVDRPFSHCNANAAGTFACRDFGFGPAGPRECEGGNPSAIWRGLAPGTYYYPLYSCIDPVACAPIGTAGEYQLHIEVLPSSTEPGGCCFVEGDDGPMVTGATSLRTHGGVELGIDLNATSGIEPRQGGANKLAFDFDGDLDGGTVNAGNVQVVCTNGPAPVVNSATLMGTSTVVVETGAMADLDCCQYAFAGMQGTGGGAVQGTYNVRGIAGDINFSGAVTGADPSLVKPHFGEIAGVDLVGPQFDFNVSGGVTGGDFSLIKPLLGNVGAACPAAAGGVGISCMDVNCAGECDEVDGGYLGDGVLCGDGSACDSGACCLDGDRRCEVMSAEDCINAGGNFAGPGQSCDPDCTCAPPNGEDACEDLGAAVPVPSDGTSITFAGDTTLANNDECPLLSPDLSWWERISLDECVNLTVDACCTDPLLNVIYQVMYAECPCSDFVVGSAQFGVVCADGNADVLFTSVPAGEYYYPVHACVDAEGCGLAISRLGPYQIHMSAVPTPTQACCIPDTTTCQELCPSECRALGGAPLGEGTSCTPNPCEIGACCDGDTCEQGAGAVCIALGQPYYGGVNCNECSPCFGNDLCEQAVEVACNGITGEEGCNAFADVQDNEPGFGCHNAGPGTFGIGNIWFKFVATNSSARLNTCNSIPPADDSLLAAYSVGDMQDPCNTLTEIGCSDDIAGCIVATGFGSDFIIEGLNVGDTYYVQLGAWTEPDRGKYVLQITCPAVAGACCYLDNDEYTCVEGLEREECDALDGRYGGNNSVCGPPGDPNELSPPCGQGACCDPNDLGFCALQTEDDCMTNCPTCDWQGDGIDCVTPANPCGGSCCTGNGAECFTTTESGCLDQLEGALWVRYLACADPGINCTNSENDICTKPEANCHLSDQEGHGVNGTLFVQSDRSQFTQSRVADSFSPNVSGNSSQECWWGTYANFQQQNPNCTTSDSFRITYYNADGPSGLPGSILRSSNVPGTTKALTGNVFLNAAGNIIPEWEYLGSAHPSANVTAGTCYWFEVTNDTGFQNCRWYWATSGDGDGLAVNDANHINGYEVGEETTFDMAWCANVELNPDDCTTP